MLKLKWDHVTCLHKTSAILAAYGRQLCMGLGWPFGEQEGRMGCVALAVLCQMLCPRGTELLCPTIGMSWGQTCLWWDKSSWYGSGLVEWKSLAGIYNEVSLMASGPLLVQFGCYQHKNMHVRSEGRALELCPCGFGCVNIQEIQVGACEAAEQTIKMPLISKKLQLDFFEFSPKLCSLRLKLYPQTNWW